MIQTSLDTDPLKDTLKKGKGSFLAFEKDQVTYAAYERMAERFEESRPEGRGRLGEDLRMRKTPEEISLIAQGSGNRRRSVFPGHKSIRVGAAESELAMELEFTMRRLGAESLAFPPIVVSGQRSSLPTGVQLSTRYHPATSSRSISGQGMKGYCSDETRTFV